MEKSAGRYGGWGAVGADMRSLPQHIHVQRDCFTRFVAPTIFREGPFRFFFFSIEEPRMHVHVTHSDVEAKFWLEPAIEIAVNQGLSPKQVSEAFALVQSHREEIIDERRTHFRN